MKPKTVSYSEANPPVSFHDRFFIFKSGVVYTHEELAQAGWKVAAYVEPGKVLKTPLIARRFVWLAALVVFFMCLVVLIVAIVQYAIQMAYLQVGLALLSIFVLYGLIEHLYWIRNTHFVYVSHCELAQVKQGVRLVKLRPSLEQSGNDYPLT